MVTTLFWRLINPVMRPLAGVTPWWVLVETKGRRTGKVRRTPLAAGPHDVNGMLVVAVHGRHSGWVLNAEADPRVRVRYRGRWSDARADILPWDVDVVRRFNAYARTGPALVARGPLLVELKYVPRGLGIVSG